MDNFNTYWRDSITFNKKPTNDWYVSDIFALHMLNDSTSIVCLKTDVQVLTFVIP